MSCSQRTLGALLENLRTRKGWTLKEMSHRCGIPVSTLSKVERDQLSLTYDKLQSLSKKLNISIVELFAEEAKTATSKSIIARRSISLINKAMRVDTPNYEYHYLSPELRKKLMVPVLTRIHAQHLEEFGDLLRHPGEEFIYVVQGRLIVHTEFYDPVQLNAGESIYIDSGMGHAYIRAPDSPETLIIGVMASAEEGPSSQIHNAHHHLAKNGSLNRHAQP